jgi:hypothetical protein
VGKGIIVTNKNCIPEEIKNKPNPGNAKITPQFITFCLPVYQKMGRLKCTCIYFLKLRISDG